MPYSQFFDGGQAFHSVGVSMWNPPGSHGCVNMTKTTAKKYWSLLKTGDDVFVYGRKPVPERPRGHVGRPVAEANSPAALDRWT